MLLAWNFTGLSVPASRWAQGLAIMLLGNLGNVTTHAGRRAVIGVVEVLSVAYLASSHRDAFALR
jgi:hypothetical protein